MSQAAGNPPTDFRVSWHPFQLNPNASEKGVNKRDFYKQKFGGRADGIVSRMTETFAAEGLQYNMDGLTGNTLDSHRLIAFAGKESEEKQNALVEHLFKAYFTEGKFINDRSVLLSAAQDAGLKEAEKVVDDKSIMQEEVYEELERVSGAINGVPSFIINNKHHLSGAQDPSAFLEVFENLGEAP